MLHNYDYDNLKITLIFQVKIVLFCHLTESENQQTYLYDIAPSPYQN